MARITRINSNIARQVLHSIVARADDKYHSKGVSKTTFKKDILGKVQGQHLGVLRSGQKSITRNEMKHSVRELTDFLKAHPKFTPNRRALEKFGVRAYEGSELRADFNNEEYLKKVDRYAVGVQKEEDAGKDTGPTPEGELRAKRLARARQGMNLYRSKQERDDLASGKRIITPTSVTSGEAQKSKISATSHEGAGTLAGKSKIAGESTATTPIPGQHAAPPPSRGSVQLAGGIGLSRIDGRLADRTDDIAIPHLTGPADALGVAPASSRPEEAQGTEKTVPTPGLKTEVTDISPLKDSKKDADDELPSTEDIDKNLPLAA